ncbi:MAG: cytochrome P450 [Steroidobacteraceae bacterium]
MTSCARSNPPGPAEKYDPAVDLLDWLQTQFDLYGDIYKASIYGSHVYVISSPEYVEQVLLRNWQNYPRSGHAVKRIALSLGNGLISSNGSRWARQRRMIQPAFTRNAVAAHIEVMANVSRKLLKQWTQSADCGESVNVTKYVSLTVLEVTLRCLFGHDYDLVAPHFAVVADGQRNLQFARTMSTLGRMIVQIAEARRGKDRSGDARDILEALMLARDREQGQPMTDAQLASEMLTLVIAGHETTASVLNWMWYLLSEHPQVEARLSEELANFDERRQLDVSDLIGLPYSRYVLDEALRLYPPLWLMTRKATAEDVLGEYFVPVGTEIYISPFLIQRCPRFWEVPDRFNPDRFDSANSENRPRLSMCPFGAGPRNCVGEQFALVEMQIHLITIASRLRLIGTGNRAPEFAAGVNLLSKDEFIMTPQIKSC